MGGVPVQAEAAENKPEQKTSLKNGTVKHAEDEAGMDLSGNRCYDNIGRLKGRTRTAAEG